MKSKKRMFSAEIIAVPMLLQLVKKESGFDQRRSAAHLCKWLLENLNPKIPFVIDVLPNQHDSKQTHISMFT